MKHPLAFRSQFLVASLLMTLAACGPLPHDDADAHSTAHASDASLISSLSPDAADDARSNPADASHAIDDAGLAVSDATPSDAQTDASDPPTCSDDEMLCHGVCARILFDGENCGACDSRCPSGRCAGGFCVTACVDPFAQCGGGCVDTRSDRANCGGCGHACATDEACVAGACAPCATGEALCGNECVNLQSDPNHCGACGIRCPGGVCAGAACERCPSGEVACDGRCVDTRNDPNNCQRCGAHCRTGEGCSAGECTPVFPPPLFGECFSGPCGRGMFCDSKFPTGLCTSFCSTDAQCGSVGHCVNGLCRPACTDGGNECATYHGSCTFTDDANRTGGFCVPHCQSGPGCWLDQRCDEYTGECVSNTTVRSGLDDGAACAQDTDCLSGWCIPEIVGGVGTGFLDGYCASVGFSVERSEYRSGSRPPYAGCATGAGAFQDPSYGAGDTVACGRSCSTDHDCRSGYSCDHSRYQDLSSYFVDGVCSPTDCAVSGTTCPTGTHCSITVDAHSRAAGRCVR